MLRIITVLALLAGMTVAAPATAQEATGDGYGGTSRVLGEVGEVQSAGSGTAPTSAENAANPTASAAPVSQPNEVASGNLPFTGLDVALLGFGGVLLLAMGLGIRRMTRHQPTI